MELRHPFDPTYCMAPTDGKSVDGKLVVVLTCGELGVEVANRVHGLDEVRSVVLVSTPYRTRTRSGIEKLRWVYRHGGMMGLVGGLIRRVKRGFSTGSSSANLAHELLPEIEHRRFEDFHAPECIRFLQHLKPDLGVLAGVYILSEEVFGIPRLGSINLHSGKVPEYRGSAPAFWELYNGETEVGVTVHEVTANLDAGAVIHQKVFPLDPAPDGDPLEYIHRYRREVLRPNGVDLLVESVREIASGTANPRPQEHRNACVFRTPEHKHRKELRRRVKQRRGAGS